MSKVKSEPLSRPTIVEQEDHLFIVFPPYLSNSQMEEAIFAMYEAVDQHTCRLLLVDCRATRQKVPVSDLFNLCIYMAGKFVPLFPRMAILVSPEAAYSDRFGETVLRNRGLNSVRFLEDEEEARQWLLNGHGSA